MSKSKLQRERTDAGRKLGRLYTAREVNQIIARDKAAIAAHRDMSLVITTAIIRLSDAIADIESQIVYIDTVSLLLRYSKDAARDALHGQDKALLASLKNWKQIYEAVTPNPNERVTEAVLTAANLRIAAIEKLLSTGFNADNGESLIDVVSNGDYSAARIRELWRDAAEHEGRGRDDTDILLEIAFTLAQIRKERWGGKRAYSAKAEIRALKEHYQLIKQSGELAGVQKKALEKLEGLKATGSSPANFRKRLEDGFPDVLRFT